MENRILQLKKVTKVYHGYHALNECSLTLERGRIYGLVGKNGAGKTTMMRMIAGLGIPTSGTIELFNKNSEKFSGKIGTLIEAPSLNGTMTAKDNLKFYRMIAGIKDGKTDEELLSMVGLDDIRKRKVKDYSLGMRQRLGIAIALLGNPDFVMLDEPVNGLDPIGVIEIRNLIKQLCEKEGMTILISSHNLPELYQTATDYIIIDKGQIKKETTLEQLEKEDHESLEEYFLSVIGEKQLTGGGKNE